ELGHLLGRDDITNEVNPADLMDATLTPGVRRLPDEHVPSQTTLASMRVFQAGALANSAGAENGQERTLQPTKTRLAAGLLEASPSPLVPSATTTSWSKKEQLSDNPQSDKAFEIVTAETSPTLPNTAPTEDLVAAAASS